MSTIGTVISARMASRRLPGKALLPLFDVPMIELLIGRLRDTRLGGRLFLATTRRPDDDVLAQRVESLGVEVFRGADADVSGRYLEAAGQFGLDWIVRVTGDCPFVDAASLDHCLAQWNPREDTDILTTKGVFPPGIDYEIFPSALLEREWPLMSDEEKEHLTLRFYRPELGFAARRFSRPEFWPTVQGSYLVDTPADYATMLGLARRLGRRDFGIHDLLSLAE